MPNAPASAPPLAICGACRYSAPVNTAMNAGSREIEQGRETGPLCFPDRQTNDHPKTGGDNRAASIAPKRKTEPNVR